MRPLVTVTSYGVTAGSARVRVFDWLNHLGISSQNHSYIDSSSNSPAAVLKRPLRAIRSEIELRIAARDVMNSTLFLSRQASPFSNGAIEERLLKSAAKGVYDFDDALLFAHGGSLETFWSKRKTWARSVVAADLVVAGNEYLAAQAAVLNANVMIVPSCVEPSLYLLKQEYTLAGPPRAVWIGSPSTEKYLTSVESPLLEMHRRHGLRLRVISSGTRSLGPLDQMIDRVEWSVDTFANHLASADFGVMPLPDSEWARGKCAYKLLQYGAAGLPIVASPVGVNSKLISDSDGLGPQNDAEWADSIDSLLTETNSRRMARGYAGRETVLSGFSFAAWADTWSAAVGE